MRSVGDQQQRQTEFRVYAARTAAHGVRRGAPWRQVLVSSCASIGLVLLGGAAGSQALFESGGILYSNTVGLGTYTAPTDPSAPVSLAVPVVFPTFPSPSSTNGTPPPAVSLSPSSPSFFPAPPPQPQPQPSPAATVVQPAVVPAPLSLSASSVSTTAAIEFPAPTAFPAPAQQPSRLSPAATPNHAPAAIALGTVSDGSRPNLVNSFNLTGANTGSGASTGTRSGAITALPPISASRPNAPSRAAQIASVSASAAVPTTPPGAFVFPAPGEALAATGGNTAFIPASAPASVMSAMSANVPASNEDLVAFSSGYQSLSERYGAAAPAAVAILPSLSETGASGLDLETLLRRTVDQDDRVRGLEFRLHANDAEAEVVRAAWQPRLETGYETAYNTLEGTSNSAILGIRQRIFDFGKTDAALNTLEAQKVLAGAQIEAARGTVTNEFLSAYLQHVAAERGISTDTLEISALEELQSANEQLANLGSASIIAARESQIDLNQAMARRAERHLEREQASQQLASLTGGVTIVPSTSQLEQFFAKFLPPTADQCLSLAIANSAELSFIEARIVEARLQVEEQSLSRLPTIDIVGQTGISPFGGESDLGLRRNTGINFAVNGNLFDGGVNAAELRRLNLLIREQERELATASRELELEIRRSYSAINTSGELLRTQRSSLAVLQDLVRDRERQVAGGVGLKQDVLRARVQFEQAKNGLTDLETSFDLERARLVLRCGNRF